MQAVRVLGWIHGRKRGVEVEAVGYRMLDDVGVDGRIPVEGGHRLVEGLHGVIGLHLDVMRDHANRLACLVLLADVAGTGPVVADEDGAQTGCGTSSS